MDSAVNRECILSIAGSRSLARAATLVPGDAAFTIARHSLYSGIFIKIRSGARSKDCYCVG